MLNCNVGYYPVLRGVVNLTKEELSKLIKITEEIHQLEKEIKNIEPEYSKDSVTGSSLHFPYTKHNIVIEGYDYSSYENNIRKIRNRLNKKLIELAEEKDKLTEFIYSVEDSELRQILMYRYMNGLTWREIGEKMNYGTSTIRLKHDSFIKKISNI